MAESAKLNYLAEAEDMSGNEVRETRVPLDFDEGDHTSEVGDSPRRIDVNRSGTTVDLVTAPRSGIELADDDHGEPSISHVMPSIAEVAAKHDRDEHGLADSLGARPRSIPEDLRYLRLMSPINEAEVDVLDHFDAQRHAGIRFSSVGREMFVSPDGSSPPVLQGTFGPSLDHTLEEHNTPGVSQKWSVRSAAMKGSCTAGDLRRPPPLMKRPMPQLFFHDNVSGLNQVIPKEPSLDRDNVGSSDFKGECTS